MKNSLITLLVLAFVAGCATAPSSGSQASTVTVVSYRADDTPSPVEPIPSATLLDAERNKTVEMAIDYPTKGTGPFPIIIFSHDYGASNHGYTQLMEYWASHGYVCISPNHADSGAMRELLEQRRAEMEKRREELRQQGRTPQRGSMQQQSVPPGPDLTEGAWQKQTAADWRNRARDITFIIDSLDQLEKKYPELEGRLDHAKIGLAGHAYGAFTVLLASGMRSFAENPPLQFPRDPRVRAVIVASPQGVGERGLTQDSFADLNLPVMFMTGTNDRSGQAHEASWRRDAFTYSPAGDKYLASIEGAGHNAVAGAQAMSDEPVRVGNSTMTGTYQQPNTMAGQPQPRQPAVIPGMNRAVFDAIKMTSIAFWDAYLKSQATGHEYLDKLNTNSGGRVTIEKK